MISFYPGPSRIYDDIPAYVKDAQREGILSMNHRSDEFIALCKQTVKLLKQKLEIPQNYTVFFTSSATECWEIIAQSLTQRESIHLYNGAFGEKWFDYANRIITKARAIPFDKEENPDLKKLIFKSGEVICLTQNETSNGTQLDDSIIATVKKQNPHHLLAVDATSSMAGIVLPFKSADIWFASVQKCFGLPAGLALMICSPKAIAQMKAIGERKHYNSLLFMDEMMEKWQTVCTPNVLAIYLLMRVMDKVDHIKTIQQEITNRFKTWERFFKNSANLKLYVQNPEVRSHTVVTVTAAPDLILKVKSAAKKEGFLLGEGYGALKKNTFRIANFPALKKKEMTALMKFLAFFC